MHGQESLKFASIESPHTLDLWVVKTDHKYWTFEVVDGPANRTAGMAHKVVALAMVPGNESGDALIAGPFLVPPSSDVEGLPKLQLPSSECLPPYPWPP